MVIKQGEQLAAQAKELAEQRELIDRLMKKMELTDETPTKSTDTSRLFKS